jgi:hypothetical protein
VRDEDGDLAAVALERVRDLSGRQHEPARRVDDQVDRVVGVGQLDGAEDLLRVVDVDVAHERKAEEAHGLLAMHERDDARAARLLEPLQDAQPLRLQDLLPDHRLEPDEEERHPPEIAQVHARDQRGCEARHLSARRSAVGTPTIPGASTVRAPASAA